MGLVIEQLRPLYSDMRQQGVERIHFPYRHGRVVFDVYFFVDEKPFSLLFGAKAHNVVFELAVRQGFEVDTSMSKPDYRALCKALGLEFDPANPFSPRAFLESFSKAVPAKVPPGGVAKPHDVLQYRRDVEEEDKVYFCGWRDNTIRGDKVTEHNLHKTKRILGQKAYEICKRKNLSSCWTDQVSRAIEFSLP